jgi:hypothetical protein
MILAMNRDYFLKHRKPVDLCNGEVLCSSSAQTEFLNTVFTSLGFIGLRKIDLHQSFLRTCFHWEASSNIAR